MSVIRSLGRSAAIVECQCGLHVVAERDECGASVKLRPCSLEGCTELSCEHLTHECAECGLPHCADHSVDLSGRMLCVVCALAEVEQGEAELVEAL